MDNNTFARRLMLGKIGNQLQSILDGLDKASLRKSGDVSIIYEGKLPEELIKYLSENKGLKVEPIDTNRTNLNEKILYKIYPKVRLTDGEIETALNGYSRRIGGNYMGQEFAKSLMLGSIKKQIDTVVGELIELVNSHEGKGSVLHEGIILPQVMQMLEKQGIRVEEVDTSRTNRIGQKLYSVYPDVRIQGTIENISHEDITTKQAEESIRKNELGYFIKRRIIPVQRNRIIHGLISKIGDSKGDISIPYTGKVYDEVKEYMKMQGICVRELDTSESEKVGQDMYQIYPDAQLSKEMVENALRGASKPRVLTNEEVLQLVRGNALGTYLKSVSLKDQVNAVEKELLISTGSGDIGSVHNGVLYDETITAYRGLGIAIKPIDYSKTRKLGQIGYQVYPDVELDRAEIENAVFMQNKKDEEAR